MEVSIEISKILDDYSEEVKEITKESVDKVAKQAVAKLKEISPKRSGQYAKSWAIKKDKGKTIVYNKKHRLTMLLENGHLIKNQFGTYGRTSAFKHIKPVEEWSQETLKKEIEKALE